MIKRIDGQKPWEARGRDERRRQYRKRFMRKKDAERFEQEVAKRKERRRLGLPLEQPDITYAGLVEAFLAQHQRSSKSWLAQMLEYSRREFGPRHVRELHPAEIARWLHDLPLAAKTQQHILNSMRQVLSAAVEWGYLSLNPARPRAVRGPRHAAPRVDPFKSWDEVEAVARQARHETDRAAIVFACATGLRPEEWLPLLWEDVDLTHRTVSVNKVWVKGDLRTDQGKTDASFRTVALQRRAIDALSVAKADEGGLLVFPAPNGGCVDLNNWRSRSWKPALEKSGLHYRPLYQMRHTYATLALAAGVTLDWISQQMGHSDLRVTMRHYARYVRIVDELNLERLDNFGGGSQSGGY